MRQTPRHAGTQNLVSQGGFVTGPTLFARLAVAITACAMLAGCLTSETAVLTAENAEPVAGVSGGVYCHAETRLVPPQVTASPAISDALGENRCRDLHWDDATRRYIDRRSPSMLFRTRSSDIPALTLLQVQTNPDALARYMPVAAVDGLFVAFDPAGEWPEGPLAASGLALTDDGTLAAADLAAVSALLEAAGHEFLEHFRADMAFVEDADGPRLEFRRVDLGYSYIVYFREDWSGDARRMRAAMLALAEALGLEKHDATWTEDAQ